MAKRSAYYKKWRAENRKHVESYELARRSETNSRKRARYHFIKKHGHSADGKDIHHKNGNPHDNRPSNLAIRKRYHGHN